EPDAIARDAGAFRQPRRERRDLLDDGAPALLGGRLGFLRDDLAGEIRDRGMYLGAAEIDADDVGSVRADLVIGGGAPDIPAGASGRPDPALRLQFANDFGDGLLRQAG